MLYVLAEIFVGFVVPQADIYTGLSLYIPGEGEKSLLLNINEKLVEATQTRFSHGKAINARYVTTDNWLVECLEDSKGKENNFIAHSPDGKKYTFDVLSKSMGDPVFLKQIGQYVWYPSLVEDRFGNSLDYNYVKDSYICLGFLEYYLAVKNGPEAIHITQTPVCPHTFKLSSIKSSDGRKLSVNYERPSSYVEAENRSMHDHFGRRVSSIEAHGREWKYYYKKWPSGYSNYLERVELPDGTSWEYDKFDASKGGVPFTANEYARNLVYSRRAGIEIFGPDNMRVLNEDGTIGAVSIITRVLGLMKSVKTPLGLNIEYDYKEHNAAFFKDTTSTQNKIYSVTSRTVSGPEITTSTTTYNYSNNSSLNEGYTDIKLPTTSNGEQLRKRTTFDLTPNGDHFGLPKREETFVDEVLKSSRDINFVTLAKIGDLNAIKEAPDSLNVMRAIDSLVETNEDGNIYETKFEEFDLYGNTTKVIEIGNSYNSYLNSNFGLTVNPTKETQFTYFNNAEDWIISIPKNQVTLNNGGGSGNVTTERTFYSNGMLKSVTENNSTKNFSYHASGDLESINWITSGVTYQKTFNDYFRGVARTENHPEEIQLLREVNDWGEITNFTNGKGIKVSYERDSLGRVEKILHPDYSGITTEWNYQNNPRLRLEISGNSRTLTELDALGNTILIAKTDQLTGLTVYQSSQYDNYSNKIFESNTSYTANTILGTSYQYDAFGRLVYSEDQHNNIVRTCYSLNCIPSGMPYAGWDLSGYIATVETIELPATGDESNSLNEDVVNISLAIAYGDTSSAQMIAEFSKENEKMDNSRYSSTLYNRTRLGDVIEIAKGGDTTLSRIKRTYQYYPNTTQVRLDKSPDLGETEIFYDESGNIERKIVNEQIEVKFTYDFENRILYEDYNNDDGTPDVSYAYDKNGNLRWLDNGYSRISYEYNSADLTEDVTYNIGGIEYKIDFNWTQDKTLFELEYPDKETINLSPNGFGVPRSVGSYAKNAEYHATGHIKSFDYGNGARYELELNDYNIPSDFEIRVQSNTLLAQEVYSHNFRKQIYAVNKRLGVNSALISESYLYSPRNYLVSGSNALGPVSYTYDALGNMLTKNENGVTYSMTYRGLTVNSLGTRIDTVTPSNAGKTTYTYDGLGNVTTNGKNSFSYDQASRLNEVSDIGVEYYYDGRGHRIAEVLNNETKITLRGEKGNVLYQHNIQGKQAYKYYHLGAMLIAESKGVCVVNCDQVPSFAPRTVDADRSIEITDIYIEETSTEEAGGQLVYQYEIGNNGPDHAANVQLQHFFTQGELVEYSVTSGECMVNQRQFDCDFGTLEAGETVIFDATVSGLSLSQHENNTVAKITTTTLDSNTNNNEIKQVNTGGSSCATEQVTANTAAEEYLYVLRDYRDNVLAHSAYGRTIIDTYYSLSPALVDAMLEKPIYTYYVKFFVGIMFFVALIGLSPAQFLLAVPFYFAGKFVYRRMSHSHLVFFKRLTAVSIFSLLFIASAFSQITYLHSNPMGSIIAATNEQGEQVWVKNYTPYGIEEEDGSVDDSGANHGYATHEQDTETGLVYMKARYYDPLVGRFYSRDPIEAGSNYYIYVTNNPINFYDSTGKVEDWGALFTQGVGAIANGAGTGIGLVLMGSGIITVATPEPTMLSVAAGSSLFGVGFAMFGSSVDGLQANIHDMFNNINETNYVNRNSLKNDIALLSGINSNDPWYNATYNSVELGLGLKDPSKLHKMHGALEHIGDFSTMLDSWDSISTSYSSIGTSLGWSAPSYNYDSYWNSNSQYSGWSYENYNYDF